MALIYVQDSEVRADSELSQAQLDGIGDLSSSIVILPVAATEYHGKHLPNTTDCDIAEGHLARLGAYVGEDLRLVVLPVQRIGLSEEHLHFPQTLTKDAAELSDEWMRLIALCAQNGAKKFVIVSSHGGNTPVVDTVVLYARTRLNVLAVGTAWFRFGYPEGSFPQLEIKYGIHGGAVETALMEYYWPDRVDDAEVGYFESTAREFQDTHKHLSLNGPHRIGWMSHDLNEHGIVGNAKLGNAENGAALSAHILTGFSELLTEVKNYNPKWLAE